MITFMKRFELLSLFFVLTLLFAACGSRQQQPTGCTLRFTFAPEAYTDGALLDADYHQLCTFPVEVGDWSYTFPDSCQKPALAYLALSNKNDSTDFIHLPFVIEQGAIQVRLGDVFVMTGTPLNKLLNDFYLALEALSDNCKKDAKMDQVKTLFSEFYKQQILSNRTNVLAPFILKEYGHALLPKDKEEVEAVLK